jgi:heme A synthase
VTVQMASGIATLVLGVPAVPALVHELGAAFAVAGVLCLRRWWPRKSDIRP